MQINLPSALTPPTAPSPAEVHAPARAPAAHPFAEMLRQSRTPAETRSATAPASADPAASDDDADAAAAPEPTSGPAPATPAKAKARSSTAATPGRAPKAEAGAAHDADAAAASKNEADDKPQATHAGDGSLAPWLQAFQLGSAARAEAAARAAGKGDALAGAEKLDAAKNATSAAEDLAARAAETGTGAGASTDLRAVGASHERAGDAAIDPAALLRAEPPTSALQASAETRQADAAGIRAEPGAATTPIGGAVFTPIHTASADAPAPAAVTVPTPFNAPDFAQAFGLQVSLLAEGGVQQAELHLNPAEMGPVSVHIRMDGTDARVDFGADVAATRHAIEAGLPELAGALRDAGFTLTGGGVSQHSQGRREDADAGSRRGGVGRAEGPGETESLRPLAARAARAAALGGVDLYA